MFSDERNRIFFYMMIIKKIIGTSSDIFVVEVYKEKGECWL